MHELRFRLLSLLFCLILFLPAVAPAQSTTTSAIEGEVRDATGAPLAGAIITATHLPTGTRRSQETNTQGRYYLPGLRVGGPYTVEALSPSGEQRVRESVQLGLQRAETINFSFARPLEPEARSEEDEVIELEDFVVRSRDIDPVLTASKQGSGSLITEEVLRSLPTIQRSLSDIARLDPRVAVYDRDTGQISAGGKNTRYNSLLIDGIPVNDSYGLSNSGLPSLNQPFSLEAIEQINVELSPYTVKYAGFTGASVSATTKSGTNEFHGSVFGYYRDDSMVGDLNRYNSSVPIPFDNFTEYTVGASLGGPIIQDKLFFFVLYETQEESLVRDEPEFIPSERELERIRETARGFEQQFDPGVITSPDDAILSDDKMLLKLDWNVTDRHRLTARYNSTPGSDPEFPGLRDTSFSTSWYDEEYELEDYSGEWIAYWTPELTTEMRLAHKIQEQRRAYDSTLPSVSIRSVPGIDDRGDTSSATLSFGVPQINDLQVRSWNYQFEASYLLGSHKISAGFQLDHVSNYQLFLINPYGSWGYEGRGNYDSSLGRNNNGIGQEGFVTNFSTQVPAEGESGAADWEMQIAALYIQDDWDVTDRLKLTYGLRIDYPMTSDAPPEARGYTDDAGNFKSFEEIFGEPNTRTIDGNYVIQPRIGFNYALDEERLTQIRGGAGLFFGTAPHVWIANTYVDNGRTKVFYSTGSADLQNSPAFTLDVNEAVDYIREDPQLGERDQTSVAVNYLGEDFKMPTEWKANIAVDRRLEFLEATLTFEYQYTRTQNDVFYVNQNLKQDTSRRNTGFLPDGRELYTNDNQPGNDERWREPGYRDVIELTNTDKGYSHQITVALDGTFGESWSYRIGYTNTTARTVNDASSPSAQTNWESNVAFNPNDDILGTSDFEIPHRVVANIAYNKRWNDRHRTTVSLVYVGRSGRPFSYYFGSNIDMNKDGTRGNDLLYVPTGVDDPIVEWGVLGGAEADAQLFMDFVDSEPGLREYKGQVVPRNTGRAPFFHQFDLSLSHEVRVWREHRIEFIFVIQNLGNLINDSWGLESRPRGFQGKGVNLINASYSPGTSLGGKGNENGYYTYFPNSEPITSEYLYEYPEGLTNRWAIQLGMRYSF